MTLRWDIAHSTDATVSAGGTRADVTNVSGTQGGIRAFRGWSTGKRYFELLVPSIDGLVYGLTTSNGAGFPGRSVLGAGYSSDASFAGLITNFGAFARVGAGGPDLNTLPVKRVGVMADIDGAAMQCIASDHAAGVDIYSFAGWGDALVYPSIGMGYGASGVHSCAAIIYGREAEFVLARPAEYLAWEPAAGAASFFGLI